MLAGVLVLLLGGGCAASEADSGEPELPPVDTAIPRDTAFDTFVIDTSFTDSGFDGNPEHLLEVSWAATWQMSPASGPYTTMTGELVLTEVLDGDELEPACELTYALTGQESEESCSGCTATFEVLHYLSAGVWEDCADPDRPEDGATWRLGWNPTEETVAYDWENSGVWVDWYAAERTGDRLELTWETTVGVAVEDTGT